MHVLNSRHTAFQITPIPFDMNFKALIKAYTKKCEFLILCVFRCTWFHSVRLLGQRRGRINEGTSLFRVRSNTQPAWCASLKKSKLFYYQYPWNEWKIMPEMRSTCVCFSWFNYFPEGKEGMFADMCLCEDYLRFLTTFSQCLLSCCFKPVWYRRKKLSSITMNWNWRYKSYKRI